MSELAHISQFDQIKILADRHRLAILRLLMAEPATLTMLGKALGKHPAWVRHHVKLLEAAGLVEMYSAQITGGYVEKYYRARAIAFWLQGMILPEARGVDYRVLLGSDDLALSALAPRAAERLGLRLILQPVGSLDGLIALRQGIAQLSACHLLDAASGEYNLPHVRHIFPDREVRLITLAHRAQGLLVAEGNPRRIQEVADLGREDVTLVNRNPGSGTRLWLDLQLARLGIAPEQVRGYSQEVRTHYETAQAIRHGRADVGLGLLAAARQMKLDFVPLFQERFDLVVDAGEMRTPPVEALLDYLNSAEGRGVIASLEGYDTAHSGEMLTP
jgi:putative molybdopterin biosynthesis protein